MRDRDNIILESLYNSILLNENSDEEYLHLAQNPEKNKELLRKIIKNKAKQLKYNAKVYHGGILGWNIFDLKYARGNAIFVTLNKELAEKAAQQKGDFGLRISDKNNKRGVMKFYLKIDNILDATSKDANYQLTLKNNPEKAKEILDWNKSFTSPDWRYIEGRIGLKNIRKAGFNGIKMLEWKENLYNNAVRNPYVTYAIFNLGLVKSANSVTYDDQNNIIPLSQRFDSSKDDIRY